MRPHFYSDQVAQLLTLPSLNLKLEQLHGTPKWIALTREKQSGNCREARLMGRLSFKNFTLLFRLSESISSQNYTMNKGSFGGRHQPEKGLQETNLTALTWHGNIQGTSQARPQPSLQDFSPYPQSCLVCVPILLRNPIYCVQY